MSVTKIKNLIEQQQFFHHFQPIYNLTTRKKIGCEVLFRSNLIENPEVVFQTALKVNLLYELEKKSIETAIISYSKSPYSPGNEKLFINVFPSTLVNQNFPYFIMRVLSESKLNNKGIIFEINEAEIVLDIVSLKSNISLLKKSGFQIAIDDVGKGSASLKSIIELEPDYMKMDNYFALNLSVSEQKQEMIKSFLTYCENTNTKFILEGIERAEELAVAKDLGVLYGQGFLLGKPTSLKNML